VATSSAAPPLTGPTDDRAAPPSAPVEGSPCGPRSPLLARLTSLTTVAMMAATGMVLVGVLAVAGGNYGRQVVHDQLVPQKIFFPSAHSPALLPGIRQYAG